MVFASTFGSTGSKEWGMAFAISLAQDILIVEFIIVVVNVSILTLVGKSPTACGRCRNCWLFLVSKAIMNTLIGG